MTENEVIKILVEFKTEKPIEALNMAIKALEEIQQYQGIGTLEECREAKEKQIPKKSKFYATNFYCPCCNNLVGNSDFGWKHNYCYRCGQAIERRSDE